MKRNEFSNRSQRFILRNSPENLKVREYIENLSIKAFGIENFEFKNFKNELSYYISTLNLYLHLDKKYVELSLYEDNKKVATFRGDSCWYQGLKFIKQKYLE